VPELAGVALRVVRLVDAAEPPVHAGRGEQLSEGKPNAARSGEHVEDANLAGPTTPTPRACRQCTLAEVPLGPPVRERRLLVVARRVSAVFDAPIALAVATRRPIHLDPVTEPIEKKRAGSAASASN